MTPKEQAALLRDEGRRLAGALDMLDAKEARETAEYADAIDAAADALEGRDALRERVATLEKERDTLHAELGQAGGAWLDEHDNVSTLRDRIAALEKERDLTVECWENTAAEDQKRIAELEAALLPCREREARVAQYAHLLDSPDTPIPGPRQAVEDALAQIDDALSGGTAALDALRAEDRKQILELEANLKLALECWEEASAYKGEYLAEKHGDAEEIAAIRAGSTEALDHALAQTKAEGYREGQEDMRERAAVDTERSCAQFEHRTGCGVCGSCRRASAIRSLAVEEGP